VAAAAAELAAREALCQAPALSGNARQVLGRRGLHRRWLASRWGRCQPRAGRAARPPAVDELLAEFPELAPPSDADVACLATRQIFAEGEEIRERMLGIGGCCRHGWPQAVLSDPIWPNGKMTNMVWLTCPLLASAIEEYEAEGAVDRYNARALEDEAWRCQVLQTNAEHHRMRRQLTEGRGPEMQRAREVLGSATVDIIMERGLDLPLNSSKIRCLHAHTADELVRGRSLVGRQVLQDLVERGVEVNGTTACGEYCSMRTPLSKVVAAFESHKKALRLMQQRQLRKEDEIPST